MIFDNEMRMITLIHLEKSIAPFEYNQLELKSLEILRSDVKNMKAKLIKD